MPEASGPPLASLYVHVPFCAQKCAYCAFFSEASSGELINRYVAALERELEMVAPDLRPHTVFFGGGTPSILNLRQWEQILRAMERLGLLGAPEWTVECNPATVSLDKAKLLRDFGVNRISMGVQSLDADLLDRLGRIHSREMVFKSFDTLRAAGFDNLNVDLMFAIPGQTLKSWQATLAEALALGSEHLSCYEVIYEEDTPLYAQLNAGEFAEDEDLACAMYDELVERATEAGFQRYEIANFAREKKRSDGVGEGWSDEGGSGNKTSSVSSSSSSFSFSSSSSKPGEIRGQGRERGRGGFASGSFQPVADEHASAPLSTNPLLHLSIPPSLHHSIPALACRHNVNYWRGGSFIGLGPSATGYVNGVRTKNWSNTQMYCDQLEKGKRAVESREELAPLAHAGETAAFGLRMAAGWPFEEFQRVTGHDLRNEWADDMASLTARGWGQRSDTGFRLTHDGLRFADAAAELFLR